MTEPTITQAPEVKGLTIEQLEQYLEKREAEKAEQARIKDLEEQAGRVAELEEKLAELQKQSEGREQIKKLQHPEDNAGDGEKDVDVQVFSKYDGFDVCQLGMAYDMLKAVGQTPSAELYRALHAKAKKMADSGDIYAKQVVRNERGEIMREFAPEINAGLVKAIKSINPMELKDVKAQKADELMYATQVSYGDEWVPTLWSSELWDLVRNEARVLRRFRQVEVPGETLTIPTLGGKTTVYKIAETTDQTQLDLSSVNAIMSKAQTGNTTLTPKKGMAWLGFSMELDEDSIVPIMSTLQRTLVQDLAEQLDELIISGDTDTSTNNISDTGNASIASTWHLLLLDGLRDSAFAAGYTSDRTTLDATDFTAVMGLLGPNGAFAYDPERLFWLMDAGVYRTALELTQVQTADKVSAGMGTFESGRLMRILGSDVVVSDQYSLTDSAGKINNTGASNTQGSFLLVRPDRFVVGFGRRIRIETPARDLISIASDTRHLIASFRVDMAEHDVHTGAALGYNVTV
jgi:HK97 family phage major capsid protein